MPKLGLGFGGKVNADAKLAAAGRLVVDTEISAKELIRCKSYDLSTLVNTILKPDRRHARLDEDAIRGAYQSSANLVKLIEMTLSDANHVLALMFELQVVPLAHQITSICGNTMSKTLSGGRAERNTFLLLHAFNEKGFICPDKEYGGAKKKNGPKSGASAAADATINDAEDADATTAKSTAGRKKPQYAGGLVLEPKRGFYDKFVLLLDFNSLYPSIIQEYNICFTTINLKEYLHQQLQDDSESDALPSIPDGSLDAGVLPTEIRRLVESRRSVKQLLKTVEPGSDAYCQYDIRQKALKLTANSMYGCLGFAESRFHAKPLAALVTAKGRETLMKTKELALSMGLDVIYGDTDSIMINTNSTDIETVFKLGQRVKAEVNKLYKLLEIDIDGIFKSMLLLKKKKYAALTMSKGINGEWMTTEELKGLDIVRRDWCDLAKTIGHKAVSEILSGKTREEIVNSIHESLSDLEERVRLDKEPLESFVIQKQLVKHPEEYPDKKSLPHVQVAIRNNSRGGKKCKAGDTVPYVICLDGSNSSMAQRAYHPEDLVKMDNLKVDKAYYMTSQVHPVVSRLCDPIEGLDAAVIASALGLNPEAYVKRNKEEQTEEDAMMAGDTFQEAMARFKDCDRFKFPCRRCGKEQIWDSAFVDADGKSAAPAIGKCCSAECGGDFTGDIGAIKNRLTMDIRAHIKNYYANWLRCEDDACGFRTRRTPLASVKTGGAPRCPACNTGAMQLEMAASKLHDQLLFYRFIFDWEKGLLGLNATEKESVNRVGGAFIESYAALKSHVDKVLADSAYDRVDLSQFVRMWC